MGKKNQVAPEEAKGEDGKAEPSNKDDKEDDESKSEETGSFLTNRSCNIDFKPPNFDSPSLISPP